MGSGWSESILYSFQGGSDGGVPLVGLIFDPLGNLYGATSDGGSGGGGTVFKLTPLRRQLDVFPGLQLYGKPVWA